MSGSLDGLWGAYYEKLWRERLKVMREFVAAGESDPLRVIHRFLSHERLNPIGLEVHSDGSMETVRKVDKNPYGFPMLPTGVPAFRVTSVRGKPTIVPYYENLMDFVVDYCRDKSFDAIVELGSGYGRNLIELFYRGGPKDIPYYAAEFTDSGVEASRMLAGIAKDMTLESFHFDHREPDLAPIKERGRLLIFTVHSIEQVNLLPKNYFKRLAGHARRTHGIHFEPFGFQVADAPNDVSEAQRNWIIERGWNLDFASALMSNRDQGEIEVTYLAKDAMGGEDASNPTSLAVWQKETADGVA